MRNWISKLASYFRELGLSGNEVRRINRELRNVAKLADSGIRGTSPRNVVRYVLGRIGARARKSLRRRTPTGHRPIVPEGRVALKRTVRGGVAKGRAGRVLYRAGYSRKLIGRFQQGLAVEHGTQRMRSQKHISDSLDEAIGPGGIKYRRLFIEEFDKRIGVLFSKANARRLTLGR